MSDKRWTAPRTGWYRMGLNEPEFLGTVLPEAHGAEGNVIHFEQWDVCMDSGAGGLLDRSNVSTMITVPWQP